MALKARGRPGLGRPPGVGCARVRLAVSSRRRRRAGTAFLPLRRRLHHLAPAGQLRCRKRRPDPAIHSQNILQTCFRNRKVSTVSTRPIQKGPAPLFDVFVFWSGGGVAVGPRQFPDFVPAYHSCWTQPWAIPSRPQPLHPRPFPTSHHPFPEQRSARPLALFTISPFLRLRAACPGSVA